MEIENTAGSMDRRRFIRNAAITAWAVPTILTMTSGRANAQLPDCTGSIVEEGCPCTGNAECLDGCCCTGVPAAPAGGCSSAENCDDLGGVCVA